MNCVGHIKIYQSDVRSYRDLPLKFFEYGVVHRHEKSGVLHGLFRVREFTQDDAHIFCMPSQIKEQVLEILAFVDNLMKLFDFSYEMEISTIIGIKSINEILLLCYSSNFIVKSFQKRKNQSQSWDI